MLVGEGRERERERADGPSPTSKNLRRSMIDYEDLIIDGEPKPPD